MFYEISSRIMFRNKDSSLAETAIKTFIEKPLEFGWDKENDGIFYFLDADGGFLLENFI